MHNYLRMWIAGTLCNVAHTHWRNPAKWLHYHLLEVDLASHTLSWQWIAGTFSHKKYIATQDNSQRSSPSKQQGTRLNVDFDSLDKVKTPDCLQERCENNVIEQKTLGQSAPQFAQGKIALRSLWDLNRLSQEGVAFIREEYPAYKHWPSEAIDRVFLCDAPQNYCSFSQLWKQVK